LHVDHPRQGNADGGCVEGLATSSGLAPGWLQEARRRRWSPLRWQSGGWTSVGVSESPGVATRPSAHRVRPSAPDPHGLGTRTSSSGQLLVDLMW